MRKLLLLFNTYSKVHFYSHLPRKTDRGRKNERKIKSIEKQVLKREISFYLTVENMGDELE